MALAVTGDTKRLLAALANGASVDDANEVGYTALMAAAEKGNASLAETLIKAGANVNASTSRKISSARGGTALIYAAEKGHLQIVKLLAAAGASVQTGLDCLLSRHAEVAACIWICRPSRRHNSTGISGQ